LEQLLIDNHAVDQHGKRACVLVFVPVADILNIFCDYQFVFSVFDELYVSRHACYAAGNILRVHYEV